MAPISGVVSPFFGKKSTKWFLVDNSLFYVYWLVLGYLLNDFRELECVSKPKRRAPVSWAGLCAWVILPEEPPEAFEAFSFYLDLPAGARSQEAVARAFETTYSVIHTWRCQWAWDERLELWLRHVGSLAAAKRADVLSDLRVMEVDLAQNTLHLVSLEVSKYLAIARTQPEAPVLNPTQLTKLADFGIRLGRLLQGEPGEIKEERVSIDIREERKLLQQVINQPELIDALDKALESYSSDKLVPTK